MSDFTAEQTAAASYALMVALIQELVIRDKLSKSQAKDITVRAEREAERMVKGAGRILTDTGRTHFTE